MARMKITRSPKIKLLAVRMLKNTSETQRENLIQELMDAVDADLMEAFRLGQKFPEKQDESSQSH